MEAQAHARVLARGRRRRCRDGSGCRMIKEIAAWKWWTRDGNSSSKARARAIWKKSLRANEPELLKIYSEVFTKCLFNLNLKINLNYLYFCRGNIL